MTDTDLKTAISTLYPSNDAAPRCPSDFEAYQKKLSQVDEILSGAFEVVPPRPSLMNEKKYESIETGINRVAVNTRDEEINSHSSM